ncbi:MAG: hypothetical protein ACLFV3_03360 [Phycisphaeraceae bacterium]
MVSNHRRSLWAVVSLTIAAGLLVHVQAQDSSRRKEPDLFDKVRELNASRGEKPEEKQLKSAGETMHGFRLNLVMPREMAAGGEIPLVLEFVSEGGEGTVLDLMPLKDYQVDVKDAGGEKVPLTRHGRRVESSRYVPGVVRGQGVTPHSDAEVTVNLARLYDLTETGTYTVTASYPVSTSDGVKQLKAKPLKFTVQGSSLTDESLEGPYGPEEREKIIRERLRRGEQERAAERRG